MTVFIIYARIVWFIKYKNSCQWISRLYPFQHTDIENSQADFGTLQFDDNSSEGSGSSTLLKDGVSNNIS